MYDYLVVGAGSAGCVVASRLSENPSTSVALIEAGGRARLPQQRIPLAAITLLGGRYDWNDRTEPQGGLNGRRLHLARGRALGGSSAINAQMWLRGHPEDYAHWARTCGPGWGWDRVLPCFQRSERHHDADAHHAYGTDGPLHVRNLARPNVLSLAFLRACQERGVPRTDDVGSGQDGCALVPVNQHEGRRWSAADGYLAPALRRPNLTVLARTLAERVHLDRGRAHGVVVRSGRGRALLTAKEIVLTSGALGTPILLMRSGIGPAEHLRGLGVRVERDHSEVGSGLQDHLMTTLTHRCTRPITLASALVPTSWLDYAIRRRGPLASNGAEAVCFLRSSDRLSAPDLEVIFSPAAVGPGTRPDLVHGLTVAVVLLQPRSAGTVRLTSASPGAPAAVDPHYLSDPDDADLRRLRAGLRFARSLLRTPPLAPFVGAPRTRQPATDDDAALDEHIRRTAASVFHPVGTCRMGEDSASVVTPELRVRGVDGLRVADASVMPTIPRGHTHASTVMLAERAVELITGSTGVRTDDR
ncbi:GMC family oxidoreductase [Allokutzneria sp. NRRL B-24872]|uniref:GMC family oxidoreductase n=1 Tax=Allokutzneria sp. NRRL B-24872 TaxID=1137961 RepID=UPI000A378927|nr:GMC family oxidoreductase N-terminal domain-containing protein [Allokutzneria sp. NRRL B-24872]